jgi:tRNA A-37 threonylcarbamoyl transferase component Bud32
MKDLFDWLSKTPIATTALIVFLGAVLFSVLFIFLTAFLQGREVSFWPPKIGSRPLKSQTEKSDGFSETKLRLVNSKEDRDLKGKIHLNFGFRKNQNPSDTDRKNIPIIQELIDPPIGTKPIISPDFAGLCLENIRVIEVISNSPNAVIQKCLIEGRYFVLKRTQKRLCDDQALINLVNYSMEAHSVAIAKPIVLWIDDQYIWELCPYYNGVSLSKVIRCNKYHIQGDLLVGFHNNICEAVNEIHKAGILHRDINPTNFLFTEEGKLVLLDTTFSAKPDSRQVPIFNKHFTPPEQLSGNATIQSDWYSIAATTYFLAHGEPPPIKDLEKLSVGLEQIHNGSSFSHTYGSLGHILKIMLQQNVSQRPKNFYSILMDGWISIPMDFFTVLGVLDLGKFGYLVTQTYDSHIFDHAQLTDFLSDAIKEDALVSDALHDDINLFLSGENPWIRT